MGKVEKVVLFSRDEDIANWQTLDGEPANWIVEDDVMTVGEKDIISKEEFADARIHLEFRVPDMPDKEGQAKGNSGVYIHNRYEIQVLDSYGFDVPGTGDCGALYKLHAPLVNACKPPEEWQTYDIFFRAPRLDDGQEVAEHARLTVVHNDRLIQNNVPLPHATGGRKGRELPHTGPLLLQDHGDPVSYRNIWIEHLPLKGSDSYEPR